MTKTKILEWICAEMIRSKNCARGIGFTTQCPCMFRLALDSRITELVDSAPDKCLPGDDMIAYNVHCEEIRIWKKETKK